MPVTHADTSFRPGIRGFHFRNTFQGTWEHLCGGMSWASLDRYFGHCPQPIPPDTSAPSPGSALYGEIYGRQFDSFHGIWLICKAVDWMRRPNEGHLLDPRHSVGHLTQSEEWPSVKDLIERGFPATICIVTGRLSGTLLDDLLASLEAGLNPIGFTAQQIDAIASNHQVVVWGYDYDQDTRRVTLRIYDSNYPNDETVTLGFTLGQDNSRLSMRHSKNDPARGFFFNPYDRALVYVPMPNKRKQSDIDAAAAWIALAGTQVGGA